ncbi:MAG: ion transporter [Clostridiales bacterium]|nr:ion transporter [Clostridiales bacterium]
MKYQQLKKRVFEVIEKAEYGDKASKYFDLGIILLIVLNTIAIVLESYNTIFIRYESQFKIFEFVSVVIFSMEYILRLWTADLKYKTLSNLKSRRKFAFSFMALIDLFAILPFYLPMILPIDLRFLRMVRITRLMRVLKINRYSKALTTIFRVISRKKEELLATVFVMGFVILISATLMYYFENEIQPEVFPNIISSLWWAIATLTTVGYGDVYPVTFIGKVLASVIAVSGIGLVALPTGIISSGFVDELGQKPEGIECPHCNTKIHIDDIC